MVARNPLTSCNVEGTSTPGKVDETSITVSDSIIVALQPESIKGCSRVPAYQARPRQNQYLRQNDAE